MIVTPTRVHSARARKELFVLKQFLILPVSE